MAAEDLAEQGAMKELHTTYGKVRLVVSSSLSSTISPDPFSLFPPSLSLPFFLCHISLTLRRPSTPGTSTSTRTSPSVLPPS